MIRKPFKKLSSQNTAAGVYTPPALAPTQDASPSNPGRDLLYMNAGHPTAPSFTGESNEIANQSRRAAGATGNGFTCIRCLQWFPAGTQHACRPYADVIRNLVTPDVKHGPMSADEVVLLQQDGQL